MAAIELKDAIKNATSEMGRAVQPQGFEERQLGTHVINIFFFSVCYDEVGTQYRADVYCDGKRNAGMSFG